MEHDRIGSQRRYTIPLDIEGKKYKPLTGEDLIGAVNHYFEKGEATLRTLLGGEIPQNPKGVAEAWELCLKEWVEIRE